MAGARPAASSWPTTPDEAAEKADRDPRPGHQGPHRPPGAGHRGRATSPPSTTSRSCSTGPTARSWRWPRSRAAWRSSRSPSSSRRRWPRSRSTRSTGWTRPRRAEIVDAAGFPADVRRPGDRGAGQALGHLHRRGRDAGRGQPAGQDAERPGRRAGRQGHPGRQRGLPARRTRSRRSRTRPRPTRWSSRPRRRTSTTSSSTARSASSATAPAWSCPRSTWSRTRGSEFGGVRPANFLDIGGGASAEVMANGLEIILGRPGGPVGVRQRLRRHHRLRRGRERHRAGVPAAGVARRGGRRSRWSSGWTATTPRRAGGSSTRPALPGLRAGGHDGRRRASAPPSCGRGGGGTADVDLPRPSSPRSSSRA